MSSFERKFVLKHTFSGVSKFEEDKQYFSEQKTHFGIPWKFCVKRSNGNLTSGWQCDVENGKDGWEVKVEDEFKLISQRTIHFSKRGTTTFKKEGRHWGWSTFLEWEKLLKDYVVDDKITMEIHVKIININGIPKEKLRNFDEKLENLTDVTLIVGDKKFHVCKAVLASQSTYFNSLFFGNFAEAGKQEIELKNIDPDDFQDFLELIYGEQAIIEENVEGLLKLAEMYDAPAVTKKCEFFLINLFPDIPLKEKLRLSAQYKMENLKNVCLSKIVSISDIRSVLPAKTTDLDHSVIGALFDKTLAIFPMSN